MKKSAEPSRTVRPWHHDNFQNFLAAHSNYSGQTIPWGFEYPSLTLTDQARGGPFFRKGQKGANQHLFSSCCQSQSCPTLCDPMDCSPPGSSVHEIFQARKLKWVAISFSTYSPSLASVSPASQGPRPWKQESYIKGQIIRRVRKKVLHNNIHRFHNLPKDQASLRVFPYLETIE